ncbi:MAG: hypothetical protein ACRC1F_03235 [Metamycoplasmataceae bacterium]
MAKNRRLDMRVNDELMEKIEVLCFEQDLCKSDLVRSLIWDKFQELENRLGQKGMQGLKQLMELSNV